MSLHKEIKLGCVILVDGATGKIVDHTEVRGGIMYYISSDREVLETKPICRPHHFVCHACGARCEAANLSGNSPECHKSDPRCNFSEVTE